MEATKERKKTEQKRGVNGGLRWMVNEGVNFFLKMCKYVIHRVNLCHRYATNEVHSYMNMWMNELNESFILNVKNTSGLLFLNQKNFIFLSVPWVCKQIWMDSQVTKLLKTCKIKTYLFLTSSFSCCYGEKTHIESWITVHEAVGRGLFMSKYKEFWFSYQLF